MAATFIVRYRNGQEIADVASIAFDKRIKKRLNRISECTFRVPSYMVNEIVDDGYPLLSAGNRQLSVTLDSVGLFFHGLVWNIQEEGDEDMVYSRVTCYDPLMLWHYRPARDLVDSYSGDAGNLSDPSFLARNLTGPQSMEEILLASENPALIPAEAEGPLFLDLATSTYATGGSDLSGAPVNWPMTIAEIATLLTNTGECDIIFEPIVETAVDLSNMGRVHCFNGDYGTDLSGTVHFDFATGDYNARLYRRSEDMSTIGNKIFYYLGQRLDQQHWRSNVTRDHPGFASIPSFPALSDMIDDSRDRYGVYMLNNIYDNFGTESSAYPLFLRQFMVESLIRLGPRKMVYITPIRNGEFGPGDFDVGDLITVNIGSKARVTESGVQRIYGYTIDIDDDAVEALGEFETSPDQDAL